MIINWYDWLPYTRYRKLLTFGNLVREKVDSVSAIVSMTSLNFSETKHKTREQTSHRIASACVNFANIMQANLRVFHQPGCHYHWPLDFFFRLIEVYVMFYIRFTPTNFHPFINNDARFMLLFPFALLLSFFLPRVFRVSFFSIENI